MRKEQKDQLITHLPMLLILPILIIIIIIPHQFGHYGIILICFQFSIQGIVYLFKKKACVRGGYLSKKEKIVFGIVFIVGGIVMIVLAFKN